MTDNNTDLDTSTPDRPIPEDRTAARPLLRRSDGVVAGVAGGVAAYLGTAPWLIRLAFVILSFFGGLGILLYLAGWLLIPAADDDLSIGERWLGSMGAGRSWIGAVLVAVAAVLLLTSLDIARPGLIWAVALLALGVLLYRDERPARTPAEEAGVAPKLPADEPEAPPVTSVRTPTPVRRRASRPPRTRRVRTPSMLGRVTVAAGLIAIGVLALLDGAGVLFPDARHYLALSVAITGAGLVIGSVWGRSRLLIAAGLFLAFLMGIAAFGDAVDTYTDEVRTFAPSRMEEVATVYSMDTGTLIIDLTGVEWAGEDAEIDADLGAGRLIVELPAGITGTVTARAGLGQVDVLGRSSEGLGVGRTVTIEGPAGSGALSLSARVGAGQILITQEATQ